MPKQRVGAQRIVLIRAQMPRNKATSCKRQTETHRHLAAGATSTPTTAMIEYVDFRSLGLKH